MSDVSGIVNSLVTGGIGAALGSIGVAVITTRSRKAESRAAAADLVTNASVGLIDRLDRDNKRLGEENRDLRAAILMLTDVVDEVLNALPVGDDENMRHMKSQLKEANRIAQKTV